MVRRSSKKLTKKQERIRNAFESKRTVDVIPAFVQNASFGQPEDPCGSLLSGEHF